MIEDECNVHELDRPDDRGGRGGGASGAGTRGRGGGVGRGDPLTQSWVLLWDCYSVHRAVEVLAWVKKHFKTLILLFVPASCTPLLQPLDLCFNYPFKCGLARAFTLWLTAQISALIFLL